MAPPDGSSKKIMQPSSIRVLVLLFCLALSLGFTFLQLTTSINQSDGCLSQMQPYSHQNTNISNLGNQMMIAQQHQALDILQQLAHDIKDLKSEMNTKLKLVETTQTDLTTFQRLQNAISNTPEQHDTINSLQNSWDALKHQTNLRHIPNTQDHHLNEKTTGFFNLTNPIWPNAPPAFRNDKCKVIFRNPSLRLCHVIPWGANFGDEIGPPVVKRILELYFHCSTKDLATFNLWEKMNTNGIMNRTQPCLMSVGSMFRMVRTGDHLWGTGVVNENVVPHRCKTTKEPFGGQDLVTNLTVYSTRGPKSAGHMEQYCSSFIKEPLESAGDGAVLVPFIFPEMFRFSAFDRTNNRKPYCVIPHHYERNHGEVKNVASNAHILSVQRTWKNMTMELLKCDKVLSSSLHGVIMAEILGIPSRRLRMTKKPGDFKFADFYESYRSKEPMPLTKSISQALEMIVDPLPMDHRSRYAARVLKTFPIHLFTTVEE